MLLPLSQDMTKLQECFNSIAKTKSLSSLLISTYLPGIFPISTSSSLILGNLLRNYPMTLILNS